MKLLISIVLFISISSTAAADLWKERPEIILPQVESIIKKAKEGNAQAQYDLVSIYGRGIGVTKDPSEALVWMDKAASGGHPTAQYWRGYAFLYGQGEKRSITDAIAWLEKSSKSGYSGAINTLGAIYLGKYSSRETNLKKAQYWFEKSAALGDKYSLFSLGCLHYFVANDGRLSNKPVNDKALALSYFRKASALGNKWSETFLSSNDSEWLWYKCK